MKEALFKIFNIKNGEIITYAQLESAPLFKWVDLLSGNVSPKGVATKYMRILSKAKNQLLFITKLEKGHGYHYHMHDCKETLTVLEGEVLVNDLSIVGQYEQTTFYKQTLHKVMAQDDSLLLVEFSKIK
jgi:quercetin dioxygenase-like cupin family protein